MEIKSDLYENANKKMKEGIPEKEIPESVLEDFLAPQKLASEILDVYSELSIDESKKPLSFMKYYTILSFGSLAAMAVPIAMGKINISSNLPFALAFVISNLWLIFGNLPWNNITLNFLNRIMKLGNAIIAIAFGCFAIRIIVSKEIESFTLTYFFTYTITSIIFITLLKSFYNKKQA